MQLSRFMISDGHGLYLRRDASGNYIPVKNKALGDIWEQRGKASNVLVNCISKNLRDRYRIVEIKDVAIPKQEVSIDRIDINDFIWSKGQDKTKEYKPYHLTRTTSY